ncbi:MAG TPA: VWA domain-containing protein [Thermoanaerobaculia bacterium]|nr:VWA domain-containing protein [Thermoanaerobaculia bacterium]
MGRRSLRTSANCLLLTAYCLLAFPVAAQVTETIEVRVTNIDVVVTDKSGKPITGLTKDDFEVLEDNQPRPITNFAEFITETSVSTTPTQAPPPEDKRPRRILFFIDDTSTDTFRRKQLLDAINKSIEGLLRDGDQAAVVAFNGRTRAVIDYTGDATAIQVALARDNAPSTSSLATESQELIKRDCFQMIELTQERPPKMTIEQAFNECNNRIRFYAQHTQQRTEIVAKAVKLTLSTLAGADAKKVMIFAGGSLPQLPGLDLSQWAMREFSSRMRTAPPERAILQSQEMNTREVLRAIATDANAAGVTMYMISLGDTGQGMLAASRRNTSDIADTFMDFTNSALPFNAIAFETGGIALTGTRNFAVALETVLRDLDAFYFIGFRSGTEGDHRIVVKTKNRDYRVRARRSYPVKTPDAQMVDRVIAFTLDAPVRNEWNISVETGTPVRKEKDFVVPVKILVPQTITLLPDRDDVAGGFKLYFMLRMKDGTMSEVARRVQPVRVPAKSAKEMLQQPILYSFDLTVPEGEQTLTIAVVDQIASTTGFARATIVAK